MKFCYLDESGTGSEPYAVMAGVIVDANRMHLTKKHWAGLLGLLSQIVGKQILEIHTSDFYSGNGIWYNKITGEDRAKIIETIFRWIKIRKHTIVYSAVNKAKFYSKFENDSKCVEVGTLWRFMALHICLAIQKYFQTFSGIKGHTILIFDNEEIEKKYFIELVKTPPDWTDTYYQRNKGNVPLDHIIDVPYFCDSRDVGLVQVADFVSFFLRRYIELQEGIDSRYEDEPDKITKWANMALAQSIPRSAIYLSRGRCECADFFYRYAPACLQR